MPRESDITYDDIADACETLLRDGEQPSFRKVRHLLGSGSQEVIGRGIKRWKRERDVGLIKPGAATEEEIEALALMRRSIHESLEAKYQVIAQEAHDKVTEARHREEAAHRRAETAETQAATNERNLKELNQRLEERATELAKEQAARERLEAELKQLRDKAKQDQENADLQLAQQRRELEATIADLKVTLAETQESAAADERRLMDRIGQEEGKADKLSKALDAAQTELSQMKHELQDAKLWISTHTEKAALGAQYPALLKQKDELAQHLSAQQDRLDQMQQTLHQQVKALDQERHAHQQTRRENQHERNELRTELKRAQDMLAQAQTTIDKNMTYFQTRERELKDQITTLSKGR